MAKRVVGIAKDTGEEVPVGADRVLLTSADADAPGKAIHLEHVQFDFVDKPEMTIANPYVALILGTPLVHFKSHGRWHVHKFRPGQLSIKQAGDFGPFQSDDGCETVLVSVEAGVLTDVRRQMGLPSGVELIENITADSHFLHELVLALKNEVAAGFPGGHLLYESMQTTLSSYLLTHHSSLNPASVSEKSRKSGLSAQTLKRVDDYVADHIQSDISLTELAQVAFMSNYHFSRLFKMTTGFSPYSYVCNLRVNKAATLMQAGNTDLGQIARSVGFKDGRALCRQFKRIVGETPASYIKHF